MSRLVKVFLQDYENILLPKDEIWPFLLRLPLVIALVFVLAAKLFYGLWSALLTQCLSQSPPPHVLSWQLGCGVCRDKLVVVATGCEVVVANWLLWQQVLR
ncbi:hypothetical protein V6N11_081934 [Hibiscus sabdariffa]|uniref:Uncharacterized protein n=1 Tax=Hibiscus sabdariffa TaxID=183260 RepID=A0ABR2Q7L2_9ROSI